jgi:hypothetical protein
MRPLFARHRLQAVAAASSQASPRDCIVVIQGRLADAHEPAQVLLGLEWLAAAIAPAVPSPRASHHSTGDRVHRPLRPAAVTDALGCASGAVSRLAQSLLARSIDEGRDPALTASSAVVAAGIGLAAMCHARPGDTGAVQVGVADLVASCCYLCLALTCRTDDSGADAAAGAIPAMMNLRAACCAAVVTAADVDVATLLQAALPLALHDPTAASLRAGRARVERAALAEPGNLSPDQTARQLALAAYPSSAATSRPAGPESETESDEEDDEQGATSGRAVRLQSGVAAIAWLAAFAPPCPAQLVERWRSLCVDITGNGPIGAVTARLPPFIALALSTPQTEGGAGLARPAEAFALLPSVVSPAVTLQLLVPHAHVLAKTAASAVAGGSGVTTATADGEEDKESGHAAGGGGTATPGNRLGAIAANMLLRVAVALPRGAAPLYIRSAPPLDQRRKPEAVPQLDAAASGAPAKPDAEWAAPMELQLLQSLIMLAVHSSDGDTRRASYSCLQELLGRLQPWARWWLLRHLVDSCPYPQVVGLLLDRARGDAARALQAAAGAAGAAQADPFTTPILGRLVMAAVEQRMRHGLLAARAGAGRHTAASASPAVDAVGQAQHLEEQADADTGILALLRFVLLRTGSYQGSGAGAAAATGVAAGARGPSQPRPQPLITRDDLRLLADTYLRPLAAAVSSSQRELRMRTGVGDLTPHPAPFPQGAPGAAQAAAAAGPAMVLSPGSAAAGGANPAAGAAPPSAPLDAALSKLFLLDASLGPVLELADAALA